MITYHNRTHMTAVPTELLQDTHLSVEAKGFAAILYARRVGVEVHFSTQSNISNSEAVRFFAQWADTVVLARELARDEIREICAGCPAQIEVFAHGALSR